MNKVDLSSFDNSDYDTGASIIKRMLWYFTNVIFLQNSYNPFSGIKKFVLRLYGAKIGKNVLIKQSVNIKYPWKLKIGNNVWIGEKTWIDNLDFVEIQDNCCISQGAMLLCGNHNYKKSSFDLITGKILLEEGVWIGSYSIVSPGITCKSHSILAVNSVATKDLEAYTIYQGNPAVEVRKRNIE